RYVGGVDVLRVHRGHVHGDALGQFVGTVFQGHQHADAAAVDVAADDAVAFHARDTAHVDLFADGGDQGLGGVLDRAVAVGVGGGLQRVDVGTVAVQSDLGDVVGKGQEALVLGHEVGFAVDFDQHGLALVLGADDAAFGGHAAGLLVGLGQAL